MKFNAVGVAANVYWRKGCVDWWWNFDCEEKGV